MEREKSDESANSVSDDYNRRSGPRRTATSEFAEEHRSEDRRKAKPGLERLLQTIFRRRR